MSWHAVISLTLVLASPPPQIAPYKDEMFRHSEIRETRDDGAFARIDYDEMRDVNGRDEIPVKKCKAERVDLGPLKKQRERVIRYPGGEIETFEVGKPKGADFAVIFIHGGCGDKTLGANDWSFGGNFNRLKNLAVRNGGVYYSPSVTFDEHGARGVSAIIDEIRSESPKARVLVACGSAGGEICSRLAANPKDAERLAGMVLLGSVPIELEGTPAASASLPIVYAHGSKDPAVPWSEHYSQFERIRKSRPDYPARFLLWDSGIHGTPIRVIDWRETLNWVFAQRTKGVAKAKSDAPEPDRGLETLEVGTPR